MAPLESRKDDTADGALYNGHMLTQDHQAPPPPNPSEDLLYGIEDAPPWYLSLFYGFQHYLAMIGGTIAKPIILATFLCIEEDDPARGALVSSIIFVSGLVTILQTTIGVRLPIIQGGNFAYVVPIIVLLNTSFKPCSQVSMANMTVPEKQELWQVRMRAIQGAITMSALMQVIVGFTGIIGILLRWITPLTVVPTVTLVGLSLFDVASLKGSEHWGFTIMVICLTIVFSQHMRDVTLPFPMYKPGKGYYTIPCQPFKTLSLLLAALITWGLCAILTVTDVLPEGSGARTDKANTLIEATPWIRFPYPGQWGLPTPTVAGTMGMMAAVFASIIESIGDYYACARVVGCKQPPSHAINRGIGVEGIGCLLAGLFGTGSGTTSYSGNIGILSITKVASRRVIQYSGLIMLVCGVVAKVGAIFVTIPAPVIAGIFYIKFSMITAVGIATLQYIDFNSSRNLFILGFSIFFGLSFPKWFEVNPNAIQTGVAMLDQTIAVLLQTSMFLGGLIGLILDNTIPGTDEERGILHWNGKLSEDKQHKDSQICSPSFETSSILSSSFYSSPYDFPYGMDLIRSAKWLRYVPFCPVYEGFKRRSSRSEESSSQESC
ncbi:solute carrier family 23 member 1-like [Portunus trituberculatus]|uniref:solute carrier family 23 member 1-like n=1 Tax=Portunus trituberculatus TaxID=210409 RepID=UPI001E1CD266|nr:solute carrier family 23 member 1-like [Portunus trituberculatus]XP_045129362.1 solute carrier family 23 member 1-like [Portunus trituberculatus]XP_045129363.1 solute carrier family 23 member 1-like [Portunus trituberculatus]XP_045129364.1 solute carrier family 23 member 1-like [Portunus trituberculatus]